MQPDLVTGKTTKPDYSAPALLKHRSEIVPPRPREQFWSCPQSYDDPAVERLYRKQRLAGAMRMFHQRDFLWGIAGHITVRDPELTDHYWAHPWGMPFSRVRVTDLLLVDPCGKVVAGNYDRSNPPLSGAAFSFHAGIYRARPDVISVAHSHSPKATTWSAFARHVEPLTQNSAVFFESHAVFNEYDGLPFDQGIEHELAEGDRIAQALGNNKVVLLQNHGAISVGPSVEIGTWLFIAFEEACRIQLEAESVGSQPIVMPDELARQTQSQIGSDACSFVCFESLWQTLVQREVEFLD